VPIRRALSDASAEALERALKRNQMAEASPVMVWEDAHAVETSGQYCPVRMSLASIEGPGRPSSLLSLVHVSEPGATVDHLQSLNWRDPVTGCLNRQGLLERLACCHTGTGRPVMVLVECPRFERVRANGGTRWAEAFARGVLGRMSDRLMDGALVARLDFHRFAIMVVEATGVNAMIEQIRQAFVTPMHIQGVSVHAGVRTALFELGCMGDEPDHWLDNIETRLGEQDSDRDDDIGVGVRLRELLVTNSLSVAHQPLVSMRTGQGALMWLSPDLDGIPSGELMEVADACGLTAMLMLHMIDMAVQRLELQAVRDMPEPVAIPLSVASAMSESTVEALVQRLQRHRPGRSSLVLSLHEAGLYRQGLALKPGLDRLRQAGFGLMVSGIGETATPIRLLYQLNPEWLQVMSGKDMDLVAVVAERLAEGLCAEVVMPRI
jgi:EAL domain-containing protein (putative c-di-GMP-specific phosphodiesterase class I)/GGDEF domain-containing protein